MEKAIVLYGRANIGKTTTLKILIDKLKTTSTLLKEKHFFDRHHMETDRWAVFNLNDRIVAVITGGDSKKDIEGYINDINENIDEDIDIYILACRSKGQSIDYIRDNFAYVLWERRWNISEDNGSSGLIKTIQNEANKAQAEIIIRTIDKI